MRGRKCRLVGGIRGNRSPGGRAGQWAARQHRRGPIGRSEDGARNDGRAAPGEPRDQPADDPARQLRRGEECGGARAGEGEAPTGRAALHHRRVAGRAIPDGQPGAKLLLSARRRHRHQRKLDGADRQRPDCDVQLEHQRLCAEKLCHLLRRRHVLPVRSAGPL